MSPYDFECPRCAAVVGRNCITPTGYTASPHKQRWTLAGVTGVPTYEQMAEAHGDIRRRRTQASIALLSPHPATRSGGE